MLQMNALLDKQHTLEIVKPIDCSVQMSDVANM